MTDQEIIRRVAVEVMGWHEENDGSWSDHIGNLVFIPGGFEPLTNANHTMVVVERMRELGWCGSFSFWCRLMAIDYVYSMSFYRFNPDKNGKEVYHNLFGHAVCLAALKALEGEK